MSHLASWLAENGHSVSGEDVPEDFYTSALLKNIPVFEPGSALPDGTDAVVYSTSYEKRAVRAKSEACQRGVRLYSYPEMLALLTRDRVAAGVSGTHGKSTTEAHHLAVSVSAYVCTQPGAMPRLPQEFTAEFA